MKPINILGAVLLLIILVGLFILTVIKSNFHVAVKVWLSALTTTALVAISTLLMCARI